MRTLKIAQIGLGPLGLRICRMIEGRPGEEVVAAVDISPSLAGKPLGPLCDIVDRGVRVSSSLEEAFTSVSPDVVILTTVSDMHRITPQILQVVGHGIPVVSTCEELSFAWATHPDLAESIDQAAKQAGVAVLGTGVNPGFLMDTLPAQLTAICSRVDFVEVRRFQDARYRRLPFQKKIGAGLDRDEFEEKYKEGTLRHVGLLESLHFIARQLGWKVDKTEDILTPVVSQSLIQTEHLRIEPGQASGVRQVGKAYINGDVRITLVFQASVGEPESFDEVRIGGEPNFTSRIDGGINGDIATCAIALNAARVIALARPGLRTMADMPMVSGLGV